jgi:hypothetical protein
MGMQAREHPFDTKEDAMDTWVWIVIAVVAIIVIALVAYAIAMQRRRKELQRTFGPEYDRAVADSSGDVKGAESDLMARRERRSKLDIRPLRTESRDSYRRSWEQLQSRFVDDPAGVLGQADGLIIAVMGERGYPMDDFEQRADDISVDHPDVVEHYRAAHAISGRTARGEDVSTEDLRQGLVHYRALFQDLLETEPADEDRRATG